MTLIEFIKSQISANSELGDLARDIQSDNEFPIDKTEEEIVSYLDFKTQVGGTNSTFKSLLQAYEIQKNNETDQFDLDVNFAAFRTENWKLCKENFNFDKVILVGKDSDIYKAYCVDSTRKKALYFDLKSPNSLNDISIVDENSIHIGTATKQVSVERAIRLLESCSYGTPVKPDQKKLNELIEILEANV